MGHIDIKNLKKVYSDDSTEIVAVDNLNLSIEEGEFVVFVGPSGCGKSTTLRCIAGLEEVTNGSISLVGEDITRQKPKNRNIAMVFQNYALYPHMTARENMAFGLRMSTGQNRDEIRDRVEQAANTMDITNLLEKKPSELSGGQQQRIALGRAIVRDPQVFLMDEPLSNLDAKLRTQMRTELQRLQEDLKVTTIYVTHDQTEAMTMGDRIVVLNDGELQQVGTPLECYYSPSNLFVAEFIGSPSMNFFDVELRDSTLIHNAFEFRISEQTEERCNEATDLALGVRPENITFTDSETAENAVSATVDVIEPTGDVVYATLRIGDDNCTASLAPDAVFEMNEEATVEVTWSEANAYLFDRQSGDTLKPNTAAENATATWTGTPTMVSDES